MRLTMRAAAGPLPLPPVDPGEHGRQWSPEGARRCGRRPAATEIGRPRIRHGVGRIWWLGDQRSPEMVDLKGDDARSASAMAAQETV